MSSNFSTYKDTLLDEEHHLMNIRVIKYFEEELKEFGLDRFFYVENLDSSSIGGMQVGIYELISVLDYITRDGEFPVGLKASMFNEKMESLRGVFNTMKQDFGKISAIINNSENYAGFKSAVRKLREKVERELKRLKEKAPTKDQIEHSQIKHDGLPLIDVFRMYLGLSGKYDPEDKWTYKLVERLSRLEEKLGQFKNGTVLDC
jgi:ribosome-associated translation inhibitor RaiA